MKALRFHQFGPPSVLAIEEVDRPQAGPGEALIQVMASAINPSDIKIVGGAFKGTTLPRVPGRDFCGVVVEGERLKGQQVWTSGPGGAGITRDGAHAEFVTVPEDALSLRPRALTLEQTAAVGVPFITAWVSVVDSANLVSGETILIVGAAGAVGSAAVQIANWKGARVLGVTVEPTSVPGTDAVISSRHEDVRDRVFELTQDRGVDVVFDTVGGAMFEPAIRSLKVGGRHIVITSTGERRVTLDLIDFYHNSTRLIGVDTMKLTSGQVATVGARLSAAFDEGALTPPMISMIGFGGAVDAYERAATHRGEGKLVLTFS